MYVSACWLSKNKTKMWVDQSTTQTPSNCSSLVNWKKLLRTTVSKEKLGNKIFDFKHSLVESQHQILSVVLQLLRDERTYNELSHSLVEKELLVDVQDIPVCGTVLYIQYFYGRV